ncbi:sigma-54-dependent Fis family transcriptional regulator [Nocardia sp. alder85J]|uniref:sigma-54-dependent Fis family transcriptional regulator n=1 Tax=Nocardia sp. alder85J TaxID=2862949 RepID=UPI001CD70874|nr:helix-turn-helix domain-containing protein [Nocardia sp. alder85J]MCX4095570.1 transcriptional regulator [Nocardia sp. alder85J]
MSSTAVTSERSAMRPEITSSWMRSRLHGLREDTGPRLVRADDIVAGNLARAAQPVVQRMMGELEDTAVAVVLADEDARLLDVRSADRAVGRVLAGLGLEPGVRLGEDVVGTNAVGTPIETRQPVLIRGPEHFLTVLRTFTCYGHPIVHPATRRLAGVLDIGGLAGVDDQLYRVLARRMVREIEDRLRLDSTRDQRRLLDAFQAVTCRRGRPALVVGADLVLATPAALEILEPADHAAVRARAVESGYTRAGAHRMMLSSGRSVLLSCTPIEGVEGMQIEIVPDQGGRRRGGATAAGWPLLLVGENGSGRSTEARRTTGPDACTIDAAQIVRHGEHAWAAELSGLTADDGPDVVVENVQLLPESLTTLLAQDLRSTARRIVLTSTPGDHLTTVHAPLVAACSARRTLVPLRRRRQEIPRLAQRMLAETDTSGRLRFAAATLSALAAQPWPGNLAELHQVVRSVAATRTAGDIIPADLPPEYRNGPRPGSPLRQAEREVIVAALEATGGNKQQAARALGISRATIYNRMRVLGIS